jgi:hypothetical protein
LLRSEENVTAATVVREPLWCDRHTDRGPFDIIGDVHGCSEELEALLDRHERGDVGHLARRVAQLAPDHVAQRGIGIQIVTLGATASGKRFDSFSTRMISAALSRSRPRRQGRFATQQQVDLLPGRAEIPSTVKLGPSSTSW